MRVKHYKVLSKLFRVVLIFLLIFSWFLSDFWRVPLVNFPPKIKPALAAIPSFVAAGTAASGAAGISPALPSGIQTNDILLLFLETANEVISISNQNGGTWTEVTNSPQGTGTGGSTGATRLTVFWSRYNGTQGAPTTSDSGNHQGGVILAFRGVVTSGNPWDVTSGGVDATGPNTLTITGASTTVTNTFVVLAVADDYDNASTTRYDTWANGNLTNINERVDYGYTIQNGGGLGIATAERASTGNYGNSTVNQNASILVDGFMTIALKPDTTLGNGTDSGGSTVAPGSTGNYVDQFTFVSSNTDSITALTVTTVNTSAVASMQIWDEAMSTQYFGTVSSPTGNNWSFSGGTSISVTSSTSYYRVIFTAKDHSLASGTYGITAYVSSFTSGNSGNGTDDAGTTITVDNLAAGEVSDASGTAGVGQVSLSWTNPGDGDLSQILVLHRADTAVGDTPTEGQSYNVGDPVGSSYVGCVVSAPSASCDDTGLTGGTPYHYKIFTKDSYGNYSTTGVVPTGSPFTPTSPSSSFTQNNFRFYVTANSVTLTDPWPSGTLDLAEKAALTQLPAQNLALVSGDKIRIKINFGVTVANLTAASQAFQLEYSAAEDCTTASSWTAVDAKNGAGIWRLYDETSIGDSTVESNNLGDSTGGAEGYYSEINPSGTNPNAVNTSQYSEWDWPVQDNGAAENTTYCFRMAKSGGAAFDSYGGASYPKITTAPGTSVLMRHGNFFQNQAEKGFFWAN